MIPQEETVWPEANSADGPHRMIFGQIFALTAIDKTVLERIKANLQVPGPVFGIDVDQSAAPVGMHPFEVDRIDRIFLALKPVARDLRHDDLTKAILEIEQFPIRQLRRWKRPEIGPDQAGVHLHRVGSNADLVLVFGLRNNRILEWHLDALAGLVIGPAVIVAANAAFLDKTI